MNGSHIDDMFPSKEPEHPGCMNNHCMLCIKVETAVLQMTGMLRTKHPMLSTKSTCRNLQAEFVHGKLDQLDSIDILGHSDGVHSDKPVLRVLYIWLQPYFTEPCPQVLTQLSVALPHGVKPLLSYNCQGFPHPVPAMQQTC